MLFKSSNPDHLSAIRENVRDDLNADRFSEDHLFLGGHSSQSIESLFTAVVGQFLFLNLNFLQTDEPNLNRP